MSLLRETYPEWKYEGGCGWKGKWECVDFAKRKRAGR